MNREQRIAEIRADLAAIEVSIANTEAALGTAKTLNEISRLDDELVSLKAKRTGLQMELNNLEAAGVEVKAMGADDTGAATK